MAAFFEAHRVEILALAGPMATVFAAIMAALIAWRFGSAQLRVARLQARISQDKLAADLFDKRYALVKRISSGFSKMLARRADHLVELDLTDAIESARFLFDDDVAMKLAIAQRDGLTVHASRRRRSPNWKGWDEVSEASGRLADFIYELDILLEPYMQLGHIRISGSMDDLAQPVSRLRRILLRIREIRSIVR